MRLEAGDLLQVPPKYLARGRGGGNVGAGAGTSSGGSESESGSGGGGVGGDGGGDGAAGEVWVPLASVPPQCQRHAHCTRGFRHAGACDGNMHTYARA